MSNSAKFLPFITEKSSEISIFKAIIQRTKGSTKSAIADFYSIILTLGINETRNKIDSFSTALTSSGKIKELLSQHPQYHLHKNVQLFWTYVPYMEKFQNKQAEPFTPEEYEILFSVLAMVKPESLTGSGFVLEKEKYEVYERFSKESFNIDVCNIDGIKISKKDSDRVGFTCLEEFKAYIAANMNTEKELSILPIKVGDNAKCNIATYEKHHCRSPYKQD